MYFKAYLKFRQESELLIRNIEPDDFGKYGCFAENEVRKDKNKDVVGRGWIGSALIMLLRLKAIIVTMGDILPQYHIIS